MRRSKRIAAGAKKRKLSGDSISTKKSASAIEGATLTDVLKIQGLSQEFQQHLKGDMSAPSNQIRNPALFVIFKTELGGWRTEKINVFRLRQVHTSKYEITKNLRSVVRISEYTVIGKLSKILLDLCSNMVLVMKNKYRVDLEDDQTDTHNRQNTNSWGSHPNARVRNISVSFVFSEINQKIDEKKMVFHYYYNTNYLLGTDYFMRQDEHLRTILNDPPNYTSRTINHNPRERSTPNYLFPVEVDFACRNFLRRDEYLPLIWDSRLGPKDQIDFGKENTPFRELINTVCQTFNEVQEGKIKIRENIIH